MDVIYEIRPLSLKYSFSRGKKEQVEIYRGCCNKKGGWKNILKLLNGCVDSTASVTRYFPTSFVPVLHYDPALRIAGVYTLETRPLIFLKFATPDCRPSNLITIVKSYPFRRGNQF